MSISSALYSGVSGLNTLGNSMSVSGDNIANVNTIGFKASRATFETVLAQSISGASGTSQVGRGVSLSAVDSIFSQGSFESTNEPTDLAIGGKGFFMVRSPATGIYYTRAGHFRFDEEGYLVNPANLRVQGWILEPNSTDPQGVIQDIKISLSSSSPKPTSEINIAVNLDTLEEILETAATVESDSNTTSGFVFAPGENNTIDFNDGGGAVTADLIADGGLTAGEVYTGAQVAAALKTAMEAVGTNTYTVTYDTSTNTFTIQNNGVDASTIAISGTANEALGLSTTAPTVINAGASQQSDEVAYYVSTENDSFSLTVDGNPVTGAPVNVVLSHGAYTIDELVREIEDQINTYLSGAGEEVRADVRYDETNNVFQISSSSRGENSTIQLNPLSTPSDNFLTTINILDYTEVTGGSGSTLPGYTESYDTVESGFVFTAGVNDVIQFDDGGGVTTCSIITDGGALANTVYTGEQVAAFVETALEATGTNTYTVSYDAVTDRFTIQNDGADASTINWSDTACTAAATMGYSQDDTIVTGGTALSDASIAFNILTGINDTLTVIVDGNIESGGNPVNVTVPEGSYSGSGLASALQDAINSALAEAGETSRVEVSYDDSAGTFRIASATIGGNSTIQVGPLGGNTLTNDTLMINDYTENVGQGFQVENPNTTSNYSTSLVVYDSIGNQHAVTFYFRKSSETDSTSVWEWFAYVDAADTASGEPEVQARGTLTFNNQGVLTSESEINYLLESGGFDFSGGVAPGQQIDISFGFGEGTNVTTQYRAPSSTIFQTQDGYGSGFLQTVSVDPDGVISGHFSNGQVLYLAKVALANFTNPWGLYRSGGNLWQETRQSGQPITGTPGTSGMGKISPNSLEQSNVDLASEFVNMIINQRGFQANSRIITTTDDMLAELINLKR